MFYEELIGIIKKQRPSKERLSSIKNKLCKKHRIKKVPTDIEILLHAKPEDVKKLRLITKPVRTVSGVAPMAIMTKPIACPHGKCIYCPGGPGSFFGDVPQSYTGREPATMRAMRNRFDSYLQIFNRLEQYTVLGHNFEKVELIIMGGTFPSFPINYQDDFIKFSFKAMNDFSRLFFNKEFDIIKFKKFFELPGDISSKDRIERIQKKLLKIKKKTSLAKEQLRNERSRVRCVALCIETRPDYSKEKQINEMLKLGCTRVELGVQTLNDKILKKVKRGHKVKDTVEATRFLKDSFLKVGYHMMPGLPGSNKEEDVEMFKELFYNSDYMPDALKIYPCMVLKGTGLYDLWKQKKYKPLTTEQAAEIITKAKKYIPEFCRILRIQRDIPTKVTEAGVDMTNLRQYIEKKKTCRCIRCREPKGNNIDLKDMEIKTKKYEASNGTEFFISAEDRKKDILLGFCRLRFPYKPFRKEITEKSAGIRELHVYGTATAIGEKGAVQHRGLGKKLLKRAEEIAADSGMNKMVIISGVGVRPYYRKLGYKKQGVYVTKKI